MNSDGNSVFVNVSDNDFMFQHNTLNFTVIPNYCCTNTSILKFELISGIVLKGIYDSNQVTIHSSNQACQLESTF